MSKAALLSLSLTEADALGRVSVEVALQDEPTRPAKVRARDW